MRLPQLMAEGKPYCVIEEVQRGSWTWEEDQKLVNFITMHRNVKWRWSTLPKLAGLNRWSKSCRLRWTNYLRPGLKRGPLTEVEQWLVIDLHAQLGNSWSTIASMLPGRTDNDIKNQWNSILKKKLRRMGIDPLTHQRLNEHQGSSTHTSSALSYPAKHFLASHPLLPATTNFGPFVGNGKDSRGIEIKNWDQNGFNHSVEANYSDINPWIRHHLQEMEVFLDEEVPWDLLSRNEAHDLQTSFISWLLD